MSTDPSSLPDSTPKSNAIIASFLKVTDFLKVNGPLVSRQTDELISIIGPLYTSLTLLLIGIETIVEHENPPDDVPILSIIDDEIKEYLSVHPNWSEHDRYTWFKRKIEETIAYLQFKIWQQNSLNTLQSANLTRIAVRIQGHAMDVEAGMFSFRDSMVLVPRIAKELRAYAEGVKHT